MISCNIEIYNNNFKAAVAELILNIQNKEFGIPITLALQPDLAEIPAYYQVDKGNFWIAKADTRVIGTIALLDIGNNKAALRKMFVAKDHRGKTFGVGQALLNSLIAWARDKGVEEIFLGTTEKFIAAQRFYEKNRFTEIQKQELPASFPVMEVDVKFYKFTVQDLPGDLLEHLVGPMIDLYLHPMWELNGGFLFGLTQNSNQHVLYYYWEEEGGNNCFTSTTCLYLPIGSCICATYRQLRFFK